MKTCKLDRTTVNKRIDSAWRSRFITDVAEAIDGVVSALPQKHIKDIATIRFGVQSMEGNSFSIRLWIPNEVKYKKP